MRVVVLGSGSSGNALVVESGSRRLLIDAGFSCKELERRFELVGIDGAGFDGVLLTHEHGDHIRGAARFGRRYRVPLFATEGTFAGFRPGRHPPERRIVRSGEPLEVGAFRIEPFAVPHDAREPVGFVVEDGHGRRLGLVADLGARSHPAWARLIDLDLLVLETNHDLTMLRDGPYPWPLKQRIAGGLGHLSNDDAAAGLRELVGDRLRWVVAYHLSQVNNDPALAAEAIGEELDRLGSVARVRISSQDEPGPWLEIG